MLFLNMNKVIEIWQRLYFHVLTLHFFNLLTGQTVLCNFQQIYFPIMANRIFTFGTASSMGMSRLSSKSNARTQKLEIF